MFFCSVRVFDRLKVPQNPGPDVLIFEDKILMRFEGQRVLLQSQ